MTSARRDSNRREFLGAGAAAAAVAACGGLPRAVAEGPEKPRKGRTVLSFYCDDTGPYTAGAKAFGTFLDYCAEQGIAGESSAILGIGGHSMARNPNKEEQAYLEQLRRAWKCGIDTHMELMTHRGLFDFEANREPDGAVHEGLWLHEPAVTVEQYQRYFASILAEGAAGRRSIYRADLAGVRLRRLQPAVRRAARRRPQRAESSHVEGPLEPGPAGEVPRPDRPLLLRLQRDRLRHPPEGRATASTPSST